MLGLGPVWRRWMSCAASMCQSMRAAACGLSRAAAFVKIARYCEELLHFPKVAIRFYIQNTKNKFSWRGAWDPWGPPWNSIWGLRALGGRSCWDAKNWLGGDSNETIDFFAFRQLFSILYPLLPKNDFWGIVWSKVARGLPWTLRSRCEKNYFSLYVCDLVSETLFFILLFGFCFKICLTPCCYSGVFS